MEDTIKKGMNKIINFLQKETNVYSAEILMELVKEHKKSCDGDCNLSMFLMGDVYKQLVGRDLTTKEIKIFL